MVSWDEKYKKKAKEYLDGFLDDNGIECSEEVYNKLVEYHVHLLERDYFGIATCTYNLMALFKKKYKDTTIIKMLEDAIIKNSKSLFWEISNKIEDGNKKNTLLDTPKEKKKISGKRAD